MTPESIEQRVQRVTCAAACCTSGEPDLLDLVKAVAPVPWVVPPVAVCVASAALLSMR